MLKTCLKCDHVAEVADDPLAECPQCGAIYVKVEQALQHQAAEREALAAKAQALAAKRAEAKRRAEVAVAARTAQQERAEAFAREQRLQKTKRWFTPQFAIAIYIALAVVIALPLLVMAVFAGALGWTFALAGIAVLVIGGVVMESIVVLFHIATTLDDCRALLRDMQADRSASSS